MDPIADMINTLKTSGDAGAERVSVGYSKLKESVAAVLAQEGFIKSFAQKTAKGKPVLELELVREDKLPKIKGFKRLSKPSKRVYAKANSLRAVKRGYGALILSTPKGIKTGREAKKEKLGGEVLFSIW